MVTLTSKEIDALAFIATMSELGAVEVESFRDAADVGWLSVSIIPKLRYTRGHRPEKSVFKVSPLGHVYDPSGNIVASYDVIKPEIRLKEKT